ncbi:MAG: hypothetical protein UU81_C0044G0007 [Microgenomates group bacterium GW2011_GWC1_41_8]|uniref:DUF4064 domain-containing protein n=3 Tax=Candidatus Roizmaniibacteriota TaxID=1752723 RepID=A0A0G0ZJ97_9BACT|nr:MAG: hypothetical protein UU14_C0008G0027 [Candidatus Roizmanbacteria bacterium GW2011_GWB1_40_7]KKR94283.1 MAG: hypothetical protein UU41_C0009G0029 [Candidatus Roizmanbacteria bacterium GW2011_GWA1_41_13]KKS22101.1 MAG: hypothetical protein UU78_C0023G0027 [Candidatus Roizmanbacteria bacterium GW2011_GWC2_41_7]KKS22971.1 MAG: hypothetical protein UU81_C0044G0007 [Microgenomates group bacterium GW2011_GWC1_41_8]
MKYKTVGVINLLLGSFYILLGALLNFSVFPKLFTIYEQFETGQNAYKTNGLVSVLIMFLIGLVNLYFGIKLFQKNNKSKEGYFTYGIIALVVSVLLNAILVGFTVSSAIMPIYSLTEEF